MTNLQVLQFMVFWSAIGFVVMLGSAVSVRMGWCDNAEEARKSMDEVINDLKVMGPGTAAVVIVLCSFCWPVAFMPRRGK